VTLVTGVGAGAEPRKLHSYWRRELSFSALYLLHSAFLFGVSIAVVCRRVPLCWVAAGCGRRGAAGGVSGRWSRVGFWGKGCSRSPHRGCPLPVGCWQTRRVCPRPTVVVRGKVISWTRWPKHRRRNRRVGEQAVFAVVIGLLRVSPTGRNISVDPLATHLIINRRLPHGTTP
jgi:hypothetical protein